MSIVLYTLFTQYNSPDWFGMLPHNGFAPQTKTLRLCLNLRKGLISPLTLLAVMLSIKVCVFSDVMKYYRN